MRSESPYFVISDGNVCEACGKRLGTRYVNIDFTSSVSSASKVLNDKMIM